MPPTVKTSFALFIGVHGFSLSTLHQKLKKTMEETIYSFLKRAREKD